MTGLTSAEVQARVAEGKVNAVPHRTSRSAWDIVRANVLTWFNLILGTLFVLMLLFGSWRDALFGLVLVINAVIGIAQELRAKIMLDRLTLLTAPKAHVLRDGHEQEIDVDDIVLDDVVRLAAGDQVVADGEVLSSQNLELDESLLTGESVSIIKGAADPVLSGSFVVAGAGLCRTTAVGADAYAQRITGEGRRYSRMRSDILDGINSVLKVIGILILPVGALLVWGQVRADASLADGVTNTVAAIAAMVPQGLVLLASVAFAVSAIVLARKNVLAQELPAVEGLARVDVLCVDKTGTITEPHPVFSRFESVEGGVGDALAALGAVAAANPTRNATIDAIVAAVPAPQGWSVEDVVPFSSARKWSAARFAGRGSWVLGAPEVILEHAVGAEAATARAALLAGEGPRVLALARTAEALHGDELPDGLCPAGLVLLGEQVRADAPETLDYFAQQDVTVKVISGDNAATVEAIATRAGVLGAETAIDARTLPDDEEPAGAKPGDAGDRGAGAGPAPGGTPGAAEGSSAGGDTGANAHAAAAGSAPDEAPALGLEPATGRRPGADRLADVMERTAVFGRVTPDQKRSMVRALQRNGHTVAMTGDGVNDVLALKQADLGIAMGSGTDATKAVAQLILLDGRFATLPLVVAEGRRVTANIERVANLFITKTVWAAILAVVVAVAAVPYPLLPRQLTLIDSATIGIPAFFLALAPESRRYRPGFVGRVLRFTIPAGIVAAAAVLGGYAAARGFDSTLEQARTATTIILVVVGLRVIYLIEQPVRGWRLWLLAAMAGLVAAAMVIPFARDFFMLEFPGRSVTLVVVGISLLTWVALGFVWTLVGTRRERGKA